MLDCDWSSDVCSSDLGEGLRPQTIGERPRGGTFETGGGEEIGHGTTDSVADEGTPLM
jgi:hypothetical protein